MSNLRNESELGVAQVSVSIGKLFAVLDHFEGETGQPVKVNVLKLALGITRRELRKLERQKRLDVFYVTDEHGTKEKAYLRPKERKIV